MEIDEYCDTCFYRKRMWGAERYCAYIFIEGKRRPCDPGKGCTVKIPMKVYRKRKKTK